MNDVISIINSVNVTWWHIGTSLQIFAGGTSAAANPPAKADFVSSNMSAGEYPPGLSPNQSLKNHLAVWMSPRWTPLLALGNWPAH